MVDVLINENTNAHTCGRLATRPHAWILVQPILHESWRVLAVFVCHVGLAGVWASIRSPTRPFSSHRGLVCGRLAIRPHTSFHARRGAGVWAFITSPTRTSPPPHPKLSVGMCFCRVHGNCPSFACKQMATLFYPSCHVFLHGTWQLP